MNTIGISPKAIAALVWPTVIATGAAVTSWIVSGDFNDAEIKVELGGLVTSVITFIGAYVSAPGTVE